MKTPTKACLVILLLTITISTSPAQVYITVGGGYNLAAGQDVISTNVTSSGEENVYGSYGKGLSVGTGFGFMFGKHIGGELGVSYKTFSTYESTYSDNGLYGKKEDKGSMLRLIPAIKVTGGEKIKPYAKFGIVVGVSPKIEEVITFSGSVLSETGTIKYSGGSSVGFMGAMGVDLGITDMFGFYFELNSINQTWAPDKAVMTSTFSSSGTINFVDNLPDNADNEELKVFFPFSSFGINAGIILKFGGK